MNLENVSFNFLPISDTFSTQVVQSENAEAQANMPEIPNAISQLSSRPDLFITIQTTHIAALKALTPLDRFSQLNDLLIKIKNYVIQPLPTDQVDLITSYLFDIAQTTKENNYKNNAFNTYIFAIKLLLNNKADLSLIDRQIILKRFAEAIILVPKKILELDENFIQMIKKCVELVENEDLKSSKNIIKKLLNNKKRKVDENLGENLKKSRRQNENSINNENFWSDNLKQLETIEKSIVEAENNKNFLFFIEYEKASDCFIDLRQPLLTKLESDFFQNVNSRLQGIELILKLVHPFPVSSEVLSSELDLLNKARQVCKKLYKTSDAKQAKKIHKQIDSTQLHLEYNYASLFSTQATEKIQELLQNDSSIEETENEFDWQTIFNLIEKDISHFKELKKKYIKLDDNDAITQCNHAIALGYERLADYYFDSIKNLLLEETHTRLLQSINYYQLVKKYDHKNIDKINLSILNCRYELFSNLKNLKKDTDSLKEIYLMRDELYQHLSPRKFYKSYPEVIFYEFATLAELYNQEKNPIIHKQAIKELKFFAKYHSKIPADNGNSIDIFNWLNTFSKTFNFKSSHLVNQKKYSLTSLTDPQCKQKRQNQFLKGLDLLLSHDFSKKYKINLRPHQVQALKNFHELIKANERTGYFCLPTGAGKTYLMLMTLLAVEMPTLIIVPTTTLIEQTIKNIQDLDSSIQVSRFDGLAKQRFFGQILVTTYSSLQNDAKLENPRIPLKSFGLVWADEAHHCLTEVRANIISNLQETAFVFGLTATDSYNTKRLKKAYSDVKDVFGKKIFEIGLEELIESKQLAPVKNIIVHAPEFQKNAKILKKNQEADYKEAELAQLINIDKFNTIVSDIYFNEYDPYTKEALFGQLALVFCAGIAHAEAVCSLLNGRKDSRWNSKFPLAACIHSKIPSSERNRLFKLHKEGEIAILVGDSVFAEGYDNPKDRIGFFLRPTKSIVFAKQSRGRLLRTAMNKENALIFDWSYPDLDQILFKDFVQNKAWVGMKCPGTQPLQRLTIGYQVEWYSSKSNPSSSLKQRNIQPFSIQTPQSFAAIPSPQSLNLVPLQFSSQPNFVPFLSHPIPFQPSFISNLPTPQQSLSNNNQTETLQTFESNLESTDFDLGKFLFNDQSDLPIPHQQSLPNNNQTETLQTLESNLECTDFDLEKFLFNDQSDLPISHQQSLLNNNQTEALQMSESNVEYTDFDL